MVSLLFTKYFKPFALSFPFVAKKYTVWFKCHLDVSATLLEIRQTESSKLDTDEKDPWLCKVPQLMSGQKPKDEDWGAFCTSEAHEQSLFIQWY